MREIWGELKMTASARALVSRYKFPLEYEVSPAQVDIGSNWVTLKLKNIGTKRLHDLDVQLHSLDTYNLTVYGTGLFGAGHYVPNLALKEEREMVFRVNAIGPASVYATVTGHQDGDYLWWESSWVNIKVTDARAEIRRLLVLSNPYTLIGKTISAEATVKGLGKSTGLKLEFWVELPSGKTEEQATIEIKDLPIGEEARYSAEFTPKEMGYYTIYVYLYDGKRRIGHRTDSIQAQKK